jgi:galactose mutarotase-like enzyme
MQKTSSTIRNFGLLIVAGIISGLVFTGCNKFEKKETSGLWSQEKAAAWYAQQPWLNGSNFQPSSAINQVEMWAGESFDAATIDKELGWAEELGFNLMRVYLSSEVWKADAEGFKKRMDEYLAISSKHNVKTLFVFFDDCWNEETVKGTQPAPKPGIHNSGWVQDPAVSLRKDTATLFPILEKYVKDILTTFKDDERVLLWDLYNEPGNSQHGMASMPLLKNVFKWAREVNPSQPVSAGVWFFKYPELNQFQIENSDVLTYHNYRDPENHQLWIDLLKTHGRPMICTEYMARRNNSRFENVMPMLKRNNVGAINWGFVSGKTNTIFAWDEPKPNEKEPTLWFHDIFRQDKTPFDTKEVELIKKLNGKISEVKLMKSEDFKGTFDGKEVALYTLKNRQGMVTQITNFGGRVVTLWTPDRNNNMLDVVTGFNSLDAYQKGNEAYFGALIGRYGNRIAKGKFTLDGKEFQLAVNNGENHLHGGPKGYHNVVWDARQFKNAQNEDALELKYLSPDGDEGYPGNLSVTVIYTLTNENELKIEYSATTDKATPVNITHHSFFNLHGFSSGVAKEINSHMLQINAPYYNPTDAGLIPTGEVATVEGTPMDFRKFVAVGERVNQPFAALLNGLGYDHNWVLQKHGDKFTEAAVIFEPSTGVQLRVLTDQPAMQFYGGNFFKGKDSGKYGEVYNYRTSFAMETQHFPDSPNQPSFPNTILKPGETYEHVCVYKFEVR